MTAIKQAINMKYYNSRQTPLLIQGYELQTNNIVPFGILTDKREFTTRVNRGIVNFLDLCAVMSLQPSNGLNENDFSSSQISLLAGGQEVLVDEPAERYDYQLDLGARDEQKIPVIINGGQQLTSNLFLPDTISNSDPNLIFSFQLLAYYTTKSHADSLK